MQNALATLQTSLNNQQATLATLQTKLTVLQNDLTSLRNTVSSLSAAVNHLDVRKKYFLTDATFDGSEALHACPAGFHLASLLEIIDTSNLEYDTSRASHSHIEDAGKGPAVVLGWVRTGGFNSDSSSPGFGNCDTFLSTPKRSVRRSRQPRV